MSRLASSRGRLLALAGVSLVALACAGVAAADKEPVKLTAAGQAAAKAAVIARADFGGAPGWIGGPKKPDLSGAVACKSYNPKQSDLVLIGAAETVWKNTGIEFDSEAQVLKTPAMMQLDWQRSVQNPAVLPCLRSSLAKALPRSEKIVSVARMAVPQIAQFARKYRVVIEVSKVRALVDLILVGSGKTEITLTTTAALALDTEVSAAEVRLATVLVARANRSSLPVA